MKRDILKFKAAILAIALACANQPLPISAATPIEVETLSENKFLEEMVLRIKTDAVEAILDLVDFLTDKKVAGETLDSIINLCEKRLALINTIIIVPLDAKIQVMKTQPASPFGPIFEKIHKLAKDMAYLELQKLVASLKAHKNDAKNMKKATALGGKIRPHFERLSSPATLNDLNQKLTEIYALAEQIKATVVQKINKDKIISDIKLRVAQIQAKISGPELLTLYSAVLKKS